MIHWKISPSSVRSLLDDEGTIKEYSRSSDDKKKKQSELYYKNNNIYFYAASFINIFYLDSLYFTGTENKKKLLAEFLQEV